MNGQTGAVSGTRPKVYVKIVLLVIGILALLGVCGGLAAALLARALAFA